MQPICPHCRVEISTSTCQEVRCIRSLAQQILKRENTSELYTRELMGEWALYITTLLIIIL